MACTSGGCLESERVVATTMDAPPENQAPPQAQNIGSSNEVHLMWEYPGCSNGIIYFYEVWMRGAANDYGVHTPAPSRLSLSSGCYDPWAVNSAETICAGEGEALMFFPLGYDIFIYYICLF